MKIVMKIALLSAFAALTACTVGRSAFDRGQQYERSGKFDEAVLKYAEAVSNNPEQSEYRLAFLKASENAARVHLKAGDDLFAEKRLDEAFNEYTKAMVLDPAQGRAKQQLDTLRKHRSSLQLYNEGVAFEKENKTKEAVRSFQKALNFNPNNREAAESVERLLKTKKVRAEGFELNLKSTKPITLKFKDAKIKDVFNIISQLSGINFVFDEGVKDAAVTVYLENATFQQSLDIICGMHKLSKKVLNESTVIVYPKTPDKTKQYEDLYVQTFFLNKLDAKKAVNLIRTMLQVKKIYVNEEMNTLVLRDTADVIEVARRILDANDVPDAEVVLEVEVIELAKKNAESFGLALSKYAIGASLYGPNGAFSDTLTAATTSTTSSTTTTTTTAATNTQLLNLFRWGDYRNYITVPNATFNFGKTLGNAETLSNPKIRVKNREKAKFNVGTRVPITTTSSNGVGNYNVNVQYVDVGVKINAEPTIQLNNDVNIKLGLEVSSILSKEKVGTDGNTTVATIGTRNMDTVLSLKDGETSVIGGLIQDTKGNNTSKIFLLGDIPIIGNLLSNKDNSQDKTELILAITPRIVRGITVSDPEVASFWSGVEDDPSVAKQYASFAQEPEFNAPAAKSVSAPPAQPQPKAQPSASLPQAVPTQNVQQPAQAAAQPVVVTPVAPQSAVQVTDPQAVADPAAAKAPDLAANLPPAQVRRVSLSISAPTVVKVGEQFSADIMISEANNLFSAPFKIIYDPAFIEAVLLTEGDMFKKDGKPSNFTGKIDKTVGALEIRFFREAENGGISGAGKLFSATFKARAPGLASIGFTGIKLTGQGYKPVESTPYNAVIEVKQP
ncbi:MAG: type II secretion system protein [Geobacteraceae bacterium]|nr:type II secretion system protein [Geobacteraceae bacterium]